MENGKKNSNSSPVANGDEKPRHSRPIPPDGGWGWVVVFASFMIHIIADGIVYSFGIFFMEFLTYFKGGKGETAWVGSLVPGVTLSVGPLASILTNKYGCRVTTIAGAFIAASGFILSLFAPNLYFLYFSFGILSGIGFGLIYLPAIVSVGYYFESKRAFATGLAVCGSGVGAFIFNPLSKYLIDTFGWRGAILIEAGIILNCAVCGAMFRPLEGPRKPSPPSPVLAKKRTANGIKDNVEMEILVKSNMELKYEPNGHGDSPKHKNGTMEAIPKRLQERHSPGPLFSSDGALHNIHRNGKPAYHRGASLTFNDEHKLRVTPGNIYQSGSLMNINLQRSHPALYLTSITSIPEATGEKTTICGCITVSVELKETLRQICDFSLLKDVVFLMFVISNFFTSIGFNMPFIYLPDRAVDEGFTEDQAKWLVSAVGISNTVGRVVFGFMSDRPGVNRLMLYNTALTICGVATALSPLCKTYELLLLYACVFGVFIGVYVSLTSVVLVDLLGLEMLTNSFGLLLLFQGIATLIGPPIAGWLYDGTGSYDVSFEVAGVVVAFSGIMLYFIPCVRRCIKRKPSTILAETDVALQVEIE